MIEIKWASLDDVEEILAFDRKIYPPEWVVEQSIIEAVIQTNAQAIRLLKMDGEQIGVYTLLPLISSDFDLLMEGKLSEKEAYSRVVSYEKHKNVKIYVGTIVVYQQLPQAHRYAVRLLRDLMNQVKALQHQGVTIVGMGAIAVSEDGVRLMTKDNPYVRCVGEVQEGPYTAYAYDIDIQYFSK